FSIRFKKYFHAAASVCSSAVISLKDFFASVFSYSPPYLSSYMPSWLTKKTYSSLSFFLSSASVSCSLYISTTSFTERDSPDGAIYCVLADILACLLRSLRSTPIKRPSLIQLLIVVVETPKNLAN